MHAEHKEHILPVKTYLAVAMALFVLTGVTVAVSYLDLGGWNAIVAVFIASVKVSLVAMFFMHLKYDAKINLFVFLIGITFVTGFIALTMFDTLRRADIYEIVGEPINHNAIIYDKTTADSTGQTAGQHGAATPHSAEHSAGGAAADSAQPSPAAAPDNLDQKAPQETQPGDQSQSDAPHQ